MCSLRTSFQMSSWDLAKMERWKVMVMGSLIVRIIYKWLQQLCIFRRQALLCLLANNCDEPGYSKLVEALCQEHQIRLLKVDSNKMLGEWTGLCKIDREGKARKVVGCSCVVVTVSMITIVHSFTKIYKVEQNDEVFNSGKAVTVKNLI